METTITSPLKNRALENALADRDVKITHQAVVASLFINKSVAAENPPKETSFWWHSPVSF